MGGVDDLTAREGDYNCKIKDHKKKKTKHLHWLAAPADWQQPVLLEPTTSSSNSSRSKSRTSSSWCSSSSCSSRSSISRNTRKSTPQILAFSPPALCCPVCALAFNGGALCVFYYKYVHFVCCVVRCVLRCCAFCFVCV